jgi:hypothetical protein
MQKHFVSREDTGKRKAVTEINGLRPLLYALFQIRPPEGRQVMRIEFEHQKTALRPLQCHSMVVPAAPFVM